MTQDQKKPPEMAPTELTPEELKQEASGSAGLAACLTRRRFLFMSAAALSVVALHQVIPGTKVFAEVAKYDDELIGKISDLKVGEPVTFKYPWEHANCTNNLIKLGVEAGGGVGPNKDIVAFNTICPHMGFPMDGTFKPEHQVLGPCGWHLSTYDLTRHGMIVSGHATQGLPQITLEVRGDEIYATGVMGLIFGFSDNEIEPGK
jgi:arsenite oxidase small subunit